MKHLYFVAYYAIVFADAAKASEQDETNGNPDIHCAAIGVLCMDVLVDV